MAVKKLSSRYHDQFFLDVYKNPQYARELLQLVFSPRDLARFDLQTLAPEKPHRADLVFSIKLQGSFESAKIILLLEHKSFQNRKILQQLLRYQTTLYANHRTPIIPIVIYHGKKQWKMPREFHQGFEQLPSALLGEHLASKVLNFSYLLLDLSQMDEQKLWNKGLTSGVVLYILKRIWFLGDETIGQLFIRAQAVLTREHKKAFFERIGHYICNFDSRFDWQRLRAIEAMNVKKQEDRVMELFPSFRERERAGYLQEGRQEGHQEGVKAVALKLLEKGIDLKTISDCTGLGQKELQQLQSP